MKYKKGDKIRVLIGCVWQKAEIEEVHPTKGYYICGTNKWSTCFHETSIKKDYNEQNTTTSKN
jgi:hypothetical protein